jgi:hypothetical protein
MFPPSHSVDLNIGVVITFAISKCCGMIDIGQKGVEGNTGVLDSVLVLHSHPSTRDCSELH